MKEFTKPELLMPAGSLPLLKLAIRYGADAVYIGDETMSLRAKAKNFSIPEIREGVKYAHAHGAKVYVAANIFAHNDDLAKAMRLFLQLKPIHPDALIISDPGVFSLAKKLVPEIPIHISTQANNTNFGTYMFWAQQGASRVVAARELSFRELAEIQANIDEGMPGAQEGGAGDSPSMEIEAFVHGAMCISYSGRCLISSFLTARDANQGACTHPCRWSYALIEQSRPGEFMPVFEDERGTYLYHSKDMCMIEFMPEFFKCRIASLKVEGRMKNALYIATVARAYRRAIDDYYSDPALYEKNLNLYKEEVMKCSNRSFCTGFYFGAPGSEGQVYEGSETHTEYIYLGTIEKEEDGTPFFIQKNKFAVGDEIEIIRPNETLQVRVIGLKTEEGEAVADAPHAGQKLYPDFGTELYEMDVLRMKQKENI